MKRFMLFFAALTLMTGLGCEQGKNPGSPEVERVVAPTAELAKPNTSAAMPEVETVTELGAISQPATVTTRDAGFSSKFGKRMLWTFGDTFFNVTSEDGERYRTNTAAIADLSDPMNLSEPLDANGAPCQALPFTTAEQAFNDSTGSATDRIALWIGGLAPKKRGALAFYAKYYVTGPLSYQFLGVGAARFKHGNTFAKRSPKMLFNPGEPQFVKAALRKGYVYLYGALPNGGFSQPHGVARARLKRAGRRSAYRFWNGSQWVKDINQTAIVLTGVTSGLTVSYNAYLGKLIAIYSPAFSSDVLLRTADKMQGPWSDPMTLFTGELPVSSYNRQGIEHVVLAKNNGKTIYASYFRPTGFLRGEIRMVEITFK